VWLLVSMGLRCFGPCLGLPLTTSIELT
jgi:hypothetical protein